MQGASTISLPATKDAVNNADRERQLQQQSAIESATQQAYSIATQGPALQLPVRPAVWLRRGSVVRWKLRASGCKSLQGHREPAAHYDRWLGAGAAAAEGKGQRSHVASCSGLELCLAGQSCKPRSIVQTSTVVLHCATLCLMRALSCTGWHIRAETSSAFRARQLSLSESIAQMSACSTCLATSHSTVDTCNNTGACCVWRRPGQANNM
jgi:hypothetical protein